MKAFDVRLVRDDDAERTYPLVYLYPPSGPHRACNGITLLLYIYIYIYTCIFIHSLVFSPRGRSGRNQNLVMGPISLLAHCIVGTFLGVVCHCFHPPFRRSHFRRHVPLRPQ